MRGLPISITALLVLATVAAAQPTTALTYQGHLKNGGQAANGLHDFRFALFDAAQGGNALGASVCVNNVAVADGLFTVQIDFGQQFASPEQRFLQVEVREDTGLGCGNEIGLQALTPRQPLTAAPIAAHANSAFALDAPDGGPTDAVIVDNNGFVGIGTPTPGFPLNIRTKGFSVLALQDSSPADQQVTYVSLRDLNNHETGWMGFGFPGNPDLTIDNLRNSGNTVLAAGNQGGLTVNPAGEVRLGHTGDVLASGGVENLRIIRGTVNSDGVILDGTGFTCQNVNFGDYLITFTTPFASPPVVMATPDASQFLTDFYLTMADGVTKNDARVYTVETGLETYQNRAFHFVAMGPR